MNSLFRPLFLDGIAMMKLIQEDALAQDMSRLQEMLLLLIKKNEPCIPFEVISKELLLSVIERTKMYIKRQTMQMHACPFCCDIFNYRTYLTAEDQQQPEPCRPHCPHISQSS